MSKHIWSRRQFILGGIGAVGTLFYLYHDVQAVRVTQYTIPVKNLPEEFQGFTILHLSDLHCKRYGDGQARILDLISQFSFDMVAVTGDFIDRDDPDFMPGRELIRKLINKPVFFVSGNHEWRYQFSLRTELAEEGVYVLQNKAYRYMLGDSHIWILGVDDPYTRRDDLDNTIAQVQDQAPKILLAHAPNIYQKAIDNDIDLLLVGHTHGGQVRLPFLGAIYVPGQQFFPKYDYGHFQSNNSHMVINCGLGESRDFPLRFYSRPEIVLIKLVSS